MMNTSELRLGNLLYAEDEMLHMTSIVRVHKISEGEIAWHSVTPVNRGTVQTDNVVDFEPIPLTEEWLIKFGFDIQEKQNIFHPSFKFLRFKMWRNNAISIKIKDYSDNRDENKSLPFVHSLQNVFFALTDNELKLTESANELLKNISE